MRVLILLGTLAIALPFIISGTALPFGNAVSGRFLERPTHDGEPRYTVPIETGVGKKLDAASLTDWFKWHGDFADGYATRIIPLDILCLFSLGAFLDRRHDAGIYGPVADSVVGFSCLGLVVVAGRLHHL
jgi:hypothetical protein